MTPPEQHISEAERAAHVLREQIIGGTRAPGSKLVERALATELGLSRLPVREALRTLANDGLIQQRPRSWATVRNFDAEDRQELHELRGVLEPLAAMRAAVHASPADIEAMRECVQREANAIADGNWSGAQDAGVAFHSALVRASGNSLLQDIHQGLEHRVRWLLAHNDNRVLVAGQHHAILAAIEGGNLAQARSLAKEHVDEQAPGQHVAPPAASLPEAPPPAVVGQPEA